MKGSMSLETVIKAVLVLAVVVILLVIFRNLIFDGGKNLETAQDTTGSSLKDCFDPEKECDLKVGQEDNSGNGQSSSNQGVDRIA